MDQTALFWPLLRAFHELEFECSIHIRIDITSPLASDAVFCIITLISRKYENRVKQASRLRRSRKRDAGFTHDASFNVVSFMSGSEHNIGIDYLVEAMITVIVL
jgi:hypothetical protein